MKPTVISLFSGIGGMDLAFARQGFDVVAQVEIDPFCRAVLSKHAATYWPNAVQFEDVKNVGKHNLPSATIICGGVPCQPASDAGNKLGESDERWLWPDAIRIVKELQPQVVLFENVRGLRTLDNGNAFRTILWQLAEAGYAVEWQSISASLVGAPHPRERVWIVAYAYGVGRGREENPRQHHCYSERHNSLPQQWYNEQFGLGSNRPLLGNLNSIGLPGWREVRIEDTSAQCNEVAYSRSGHESGESDAPTFPRMGRMFDGFPDWLDGHQYQWPKGIGAEQHEWEPRRVAPTNTPYRDNRIRALGNAVVPQVVEPIAAAIKQYLEGIS